MPAPKKATKPKRGPAPRKPGPAKTTKRVKVPIASRPALGVAQRTARNRLIVQRVVQGWTWPAIAGEAGLSVSQVQRVHAQTVDEAPFRLSSDPIRVVEGIFQAFQLSVGDFEAIGQAALEEGNLSAAVGAKKQANEARAKVIGLLQATNRLPRELGALRHLIDLRAIAVGMLDAIDGLEREASLIAQIDDPESRAEALREAVSKVRGTFGEIVGLERPQAIEGHADDVAA